MVPIFVLIVNDRGHKIEDPRPVGRDRFSENMTVDQQTCQQCKQQFELTAEDRSLLDLLRVPDPTFCPQCRNIRRMTWRSERSLFKRKCDKCSKEKIFIYPAGAPYTVYCRDCWLSDSWDGKDYAMEYNFKRPFFEQFKELLSRVPRPGIIKQKSSVNSEYTNRVTDLKDCYLVFAATANENCRYSTWLTNTKEIVDCYNVQKSERCYECIDCMECYNLAFSRESTNCRDSRFLLNCHNVSNCFGCVNLRNKQYCIFNEQYSKGEYDRKLKEMNLSSAKSAEEVKTKFKEFTKQFIMPAIVTKQSSNVSGNWIFNCKDLTRSFTCNNVENGRYCTSVFIQAKDVMDFTNWGAVAERIYEVCNGGIQIANVKFASDVWENVTDAEYIMNCHGSRDLFGCIGIKKGQYCILNKEYSKQEYEAMVEKIKKQMDEVPYADAQGRVYKYGEFFPSEISPWAYNQSNAQEYFPTTREKAEALGFRWADDTEKNYKITLSANNLPDSSREADDTIVGQVIECAHKGECHQQCTTAFRILLEDLELYKRANFPLPRLCPNCRHYERAAKRNSYEWHQRSCMCAGAQSEKSHTNAAPHFHGTDHCPNQFECSYAASRPEVIYCEACYNAEVA